MKKIKYFLMLIVLLLSVSDVIAQAKTVRGLVKDSRETLVGVNVVVMNAENRVFTGVSTDISGGFLLRLPEGEGLYISFSFIGYKTQKIAYIGQKVINVTMKSDALLMDEVIVTGVDQRDVSGVSYKNIGSAVERLTMEGIDEMPVTSIGDALQGKLAGVDIVSTSGAPGSGMSIRIRGVSSLSTSSEPLIVLDGVPKETEFGDDFDFATATDEDLSGLVNLSPNDIESIEVLKDAAATAIYGPRAANGVLVITTKQGVVGPMRITINQKFSVNFETEAIERLDGKQYVAYAQDALWNQYIEGGATNKAHYDALSSPEINFTNNPDSKEFNQNTNWLEEITRTGFQSETTAALSGGGERTMYNFSIGYLSQEGTMVGTNFERLNTRLNLTYKFSNRFRVTTGIAFSQGIKNDHFGTDSRQKAMNHMPNVSPYVMEDDAVTRTPFYFSPQNILNRAYPTTYNVVAMANESQKEAITRGVDLNLALTYDFAEKLKGLKYTGIFSFDLGTSATEAFLPYVVTGALATSDNYNSGLNKTNNNTQLYVENKLIYNKLFAHKHGLVAMIKMDISDRRNNSTDTEVAGMSSTGLSNPILGTGRITSFKSQEGRNRDFGMAVNLNYAYSSRYIFNFAYRFGANSRVNAANRWKGNPATSFVWRINNESFMESAEWVSDLRLRASWGISLKNPTGNNPGVGEFTAGDHYGEYGTVGPTAMDLTNLNYEVLNKTNIGVDFAIMNDMFTLTADYFSNTVSDMLQKNAELPSHTGIKTISYFNSGSMTTEGWELRIASKSLLENKDYHLSFSFNMSQQQNIIEELPSNANYLQYSETIKNGEFAQNIQEGDALGSFYGFRSLGVYSDLEDTYIKNPDGSVALDVLGRPVQMLHHTRTVKPGDAIYEDLNGDGLIDKYDIVYIGNSLPKFIGGLGFTVGYKSLRLTTSFQARLGYDIINDARMRSEGMSTYDNQNVNVLNRWRHDGDVTDVPKAIFGNKHYNWLGSDRFVEDGSFIRLKELRLSYALPKHFTQRMKMAKCSMFITGYDLFTFTGYSGQDPEVSITGGINTSGKFSLMGVDKAKTPKPRRIAAGLTIQF